MLIFVWELKQSSTLTCDITHYQMRKSQISGEARACAQGLASCDGRSQHQGRGAAGVDRGAEAGLPVFLEAGGRRAGGRGWAAGGGHTGPGPGRGAAAGQIRGGADLRMRGDDLVHAGVVDANTVNDIQ